MFAVQYFPLADLRQTYNLGNNWFYTLRAGQAFGWISFVFALVALIGTLSQLLGLCSVAGTRSVVLYASILTLPCGIIFCAATGWAISIAARFNLDYKTTLGPGAGTAIAATLLSLLAISLSCEAGSSSSGEGSLVLKSPGGWDRPAQPREGMEGSAVKLALSPVSPPQLGTPQSALNLRLQ